MPFFIIFVFLLFEPVWAQDIHLSHNSETVEPQQLHKKNARVEQFNNYNQAINKVEKAVKIIDKYLVGACDILSFGQFSKAIEFADKKSSEAAVKFNQGNFAEGAVDLIMTPFIGTAQMVLGTTSIIYPSAKISAKGVGLATKAIGPRSNWVRFGKSMRAKEDTMYFGLQWGAGKPKYTQQIGSKTLQGLNQRLRKIGDGHWDLWKIKK